MKRVSLRARRQRQGGGGHHDDDQVQLLGDGDEHQHEAGDEAVLCQGDDDGAHPLPEAGAGDVGSLFQFHADGQHVGGTGTAGEGEVLDHGGQNDKGKGAVQGGDQTALGTTLVNDVLPSRWRSPGDNFYAWAGRIGIPLGIALGFLLQLLFPLPAAWLWSLLPCVVAFLLVAQTEVPLKAPVKVPLLTLDRFVWPGSWRLSLTMFAAPWLLGRVVAAPIGLEACLLLVGGTVLAFLWALLARERFDRLPWFGYLSYVLLLLALCLPKVGVQPDFWPMFVLLGFGVGSLSARHLQLWIWQAEHCQRGTAQNTYMLSWRLSFAIGFAATACWGGN